ncbi:hypothetical protein S7711_09861, partial [Stachybotrys chartarum IBT 7711]
CNVHVAIAANAFDRFHTSLASIHRCHGYFLIQVSLMPRATTKVLAVHLDKDHHDAFSRAVQTILACNMAEVTMAQLVDGLPQSSVAWEARGNSLSKARPLADHKQLCEGALEKIQSLQDECNPDTLSFEPYLLQAYSDIETGSNEFNIRLIEMLAVSVHQIAIALFNFVPKAHTSEHIKYVTKWQKPSGWAEYVGRKNWEEPFFPPPPTHFFHCAYTDFDLYPNGLSDIAGVFLYSGRSTETCRIWRVSESQLTVLVDFLLGKAFPGGFSLPLAATDENRHRFDPWDAIVECVEVRRMRGRNEYDGRTV